jgi:indolepyruvate ferredoxin oxidoreductase
MSSNSSFSLTDRYTVESGRVLLSGIQALVRLPIEQMRRDRNRSLNTGVFISGYRGSPLGGYDLQLMNNRDLLAQYNVRFQPGVNEELAATAVWGSQQVNLFEGATVDGVCGIWYGKTPGVDRSTDAFRHGNAAGSSPFGGVLVVAGDDHGCKSSSYPGQSEFAFVDMHMPILNPANVQEVLDYGLYGLELSRFCGCWVAMITLTENMDSASTVNVDSERVKIELPTGLEMPEGGLNIRLPDTPLEQEERLWRYKRPAALAFCRANNLNKVLLDPEDARLGVVTTGKGHLDFMQALEHLGIDSDEASRLGIKILKIGMTYPLDVAGIRDFARGLDMLFVVEEKRGLIEVQLKEELYNVEVVDPNFPKIVGKLDALDRPLMPSYGELSPEIIAKVLKQLLPELDHAPEKAAAGDVLAVDACPGSPMARPVQRAAHFCSGCPHNTSTRVPDGSRALAGIGCHYLVQGMDRSTYTFSQMGGEGVGWIGQSHFTNTPHVFVNLGDGTYFHSGVLAIRASVAAKVNITYKILYNQAVAMTGGQPHDGDLRPESIIKQVLAEGVRRVVWVVDDLNRRRGDVPRGVDVRHRDDLDSVQRELRECEGVTCILYDQACATELRRKRKRGLLPAPQQRVIINHQVCEGCGDCSVQSNCLAVEPRETASGTKRKINQTMCNQDLSCVKGFCPSFVVVEGGTPKKPEAAEADFVALGETLPSPDLPDLSAPWNILVTGVGGTGVVTVGALLATAALIDGKAATTLDQTGLAQKGGAVYSHIRIGQSDNQLQAVRLSSGSADALIACDLVAAAAEGPCLAKLDPGRSQLVVNTEVSPTADFVMGKQEEGIEQSLLDRLRSRGESAMTLENFELTTRALGQTTCANITMLGCAYQLGLIPLAAETIFRAIELNGVAVSDNKAAFNVGRLAAADPARLETILDAPQEGVCADPKSLDELIEFHSRFLREYQDNAYSEKYRQLMRKVQSREHEIEPGSESLSLQVARCAAKLMAYKDEYEVARLYTSGEFERELKNTFSGDYRLVFNLAPPLLSKPDPVTGIAKKMQFGPWMLHGFKFLAKLKFLRGTRADIFSYTAERKQERQLIDRYFDTVEQLLEMLSAEKLDLATQIASLPEEIRGYGHVKQRSIELVSAEWSELLAQYCNNSKG